MFFLLLCIGFFSMHTTVHAVPEGNFLIPGKSISQVFLHLQDNNRMPDDFSLSSFKVANPDKKLRTSSQVFHTNIERDGELDLFSFLNTIKKLPDCDQLEDKLEKLDVLIVSGQDNISFTVLTSLCYFSFDNEDFLLHATLILVPLLSLVMHWKTISAFFGLE